MTITPDILVQREVLACASSLVHTLAGGPGECTFPGGVHEAGRLMDQAQELSFPVQDFEEAAREAGWERGKDEDGDDCFARASDDPDHSYAESWEALCEYEGIEPHDREVFEHWIVTDWMGKKLEERGARVDPDFAGLTIWGRTTTGQAISMDSVIADICADINRPLDERLADA